MDLISPFTYKSISNTHPGELVFVEVGYSDNRYAIVLPTLQDGNRLAVVLNPPTGGHQHLARCKILDGEEYCLSAGNAWALELVGLDKVHEIPSGGIGSILLTDEHPHLIALSGGDAPRPLNLSLDTYESNQHAVGIKCPRWKIWQNKESVNKPGCTPLFQSF